MDPIRSVRRFVTVAWMTLVVIFAILALLAHVVPLTGRSLFIVRGGSMGSALPIGSLLVVEPVDAAAIDVGDVITFHTPSGIAVTHRVLRVVSTGPELRFETKGDANPAADPSLLPASTMVGRAFVFAPFLGYVAATLAQPFGAVSAVSMLCALLLCMRMLEDVDPTARRTSRTRARLDEISHPHPSRT